ncbi:Nn.00g080360.m01.CDS01 [Neocucurbitaria sp. VM-36]
MSTTPSSNIPSDGILHDPHATLLHPQLASSYYMPESIDFDAFWKNFDYDDLAVDDLDGLTQAVNGGPAPIDSESSMSTTLEVCGRPEKKSITLHGDNPHGWIMPIYTYTKDLSFVPKDWSEVSPRSQLPHQPPEDGTPGKKTMQQNKKGALILSFNASGNFQTIGKDRSNKEPTLHYLTTGQESTTRMFETNYNLQDTVDPLQAGPFTNIDFQPSLTPDPLDILRHGRKDDQNFQDNLTFRVETKRVFICTYGGCNKRYARIPDLRRHHRGAHQGNHQFKCRAGRCERATRGFSRRDKRDTHEKSMHLKRGERLSG